MIVYVFLLIITTVGVFRLFLNITSKRCTSRVVLCGKTVVITGANTGIGYETALDLASRGARVILAVRNPLLGEEARRKIVKETFNPNVIVRVLDLASLESVRTFAKEIIVNEHRLDVLVNNAGANYTGNHYTKDGLHILMQVNHFGPFLLTNLLVPLLKKSAPSRIVTVSSLMAKYARLSADNLNDPPKLPFDDFLVTSGYCNAKLYNILMSNVLAEKLRGSGVTSNSLHPGYVATRIERNLWAPRILAVRPFQRSAELGAQTTIHCAVDQNMANVSGKFLDNCATVPQYDTVNDNLARQIWEKSEQLVEPDNPDRL